MIITILNDSDWGGTQDFLNIPPSKRTFPHTLRTMIEHYKSSDPSPSEIEIQIHKDLFATQFSYLLNPAQLAKHASISSGFKRHTGKRVGDWVVVMVTNEPLPQNFWQQAIDSVRQKGTVTFHQDEVPTTYWHTPSLLKYRLKATTGIKNTRVVKTANKLKIITPK